MKSTKLTNETMPFGDEILCRIEATKDFFCNRKPIKEGARGGFVSKKAYICDKSWVDKGSCVLDRSRIENSLIYSSIVNNSSIKESITSNSRIDLSMIDESTISESKIKFSRISSSHPSESTIINSTIIEIPILNTSKINSCYIKMAREINTCTIHNAKIEDDDQLDFIDETIKTCPITITGTTINIILYNNVIAIGCQKMTRDEWRTIDPCYFPDKSLQLLWETNKHWIFECSIAHEKTSHLTETVHNAINTIRKDLNLNSFKEINNYNSIVEDSGIDILPIYSDNYYIGKV